MGTALLIPAFLISLVYSGKKSPLSSRDVPDTLSNPLVAAGSNWTIFKVPSNPNRPGIL